MPPAGVSHDHPAPMIERGIEEDVFRDTNLEWLIPIIRGEGRVSAESMRRTEPGRVHG